MRALLFLVGASLSALPLYASAHSLGVSFDTNSDGIHIDIGYSTAAPVVGESVIFDFNLPIDEDSVDYTDTWVRVTDADGNVVLATAVYNATFGGPRMSYVFPRAGAYTISVRYENVGDALTKVEFPITVVPGGSTQGFSTIPWYVTALGGLLLGGVGVFLVLRKDALLKRRPKV